MSESFKNLNIWKDSVELSLEIYSITNTFPKDEIFGMTSQLRRAVISVSSNIAEGSGRSSKKEYIRFIDISIGSLHEVESLIEICKKLSYVNEVDYDKLIVHIKNIGLSIGGFRKYLLTKQ